MCSCGRRGALCLEDLLLCSPKQTGSEWTLKCLSGVCISEKVCVPLLISWWPDICSAFVYRGNKKPFNLSGSCLLGTLTCRATSENTRLVFYSSEGCWCRFTTAHCAGFGPLGVHPSPWGSLLYPSTSTHHSLLGSSGVWGRHLVQGEERGHINGQGDKFGQ